MTNPKSNSEEVELLREFGGLMKFHIGLQLNNQLSRKDSHKFQEIIDEAYSYALNTLRDRRTPQPPKDSGLVQ